MFDCLSVWRPLHTPWTRSVFLHDKHWPIIKWIQRFGLGEFLEDDAIRGSSVLEDVFYTTAPAAQADRSVGIQQNRFFHILQQLWQFHLRSIRHGRGVGVMHPDEEQASIGVLRILGKHKPSSGATHRKQPKVEDIAIRIVCIHQIIHLNYWMRAASMDGPCIDQLVNP